MDKVVIFAHAGGTAILRPAPNARLCLVDGEAMPFFVLQRAEGLIDEPFETALAAIKPKWAETQTAFVERIRDKDVPADATDVSIVNASQVPTDRTFRAALRPDLSIDMDRARDIQRSRLRAEREPMLKALDLEYQLADERGDGVAKSEIARKKQALRDVTKATVIDAAKTATALAKIDIASILTQG